MYFVSNNICVRSISHVNGESVYGFDLSAAKVFCVGSGCENCDFTHKLLFKLLHSKSYSIVVEAGADIVGAEPVVCVCGAAAVVGVGNEVVSFSISSPELLWRHCIDTVLLGIIRTSKGVVLIGEVCTQCLLDDGSVLWSHSTDLVSGFMLTKNNVLQIDTMEGGVIKIVLESGSLEE